MTCRMTRRVLLSALLATPALQTQARAKEFNLRIGAILPLGGSLVPDSPNNLYDLSETALRGLVSGEEDVAQNATLFGHDIKLLTANAPGAEAATRAAERLVSVNGVDVLIGGFTEDDARAIASVAQDTGRLFMNIAADSIALRDGCNRHCLHLGASAAMYLDALAGWYMRAGFRRWIIVRGQGIEQDIRTTRAKGALEGRHWGAEILAVLTAVREDFGDVAREIARLKPDVVLLLTDWHSQIDFLAQYDAERLPFPVAAYPEAATQTRKYYADVLRAAPNAGAGYRAALWEATLDAYGARELNARAAARWGRPLDPTGWAAYQAVKIAYDAAQLSGSTDGAALAAYLTHPDTVLDVHKGIGVSFRPWDNQLRQSLYLVRLNLAVGARLDVASLDARATLVGELPAIYMPGTDPVDRLDQLGDLQPFPECHS